MGCRRNLCGPSRSGEGRSDSKIRWRPSGVTYEGIDVAERAGRKGGGIGLLYVLLARCETLI
jgi:hypothetical protein